MMYIGASPHYLNLYANWVPISPKDTQTNNKEWIGVRVRCQTLLEFVK